jgi:hypothetical protein
MNRHMVMSMTCPKYSSSLNVRQYELKEAMAKRFKEEGIVKILKEAE